MQFALNLWAVGFHNSEIALYSLSHKRYKKTMWSSIESDFEINSFKKDKSDKFSSENELSDTISSNQRKKNMLKNLYAYSFG